MVSSEKIIKFFCGLLLLKYMVMKYMEFGFHRFLKVAVIGKVLLQSSGLMKTEAFTKKEVNGNDLDTPT